MQSILSQHLIADFAANGEEVVAKLRQEKPVEYMKMVNAILNQAGTPEAAKSTGYTVIERHIVRPDSPDG